MSVFGKIESGVLKGRMIILEPRVGLEVNEYLVENGRLFNGPREFSKYCLVCDKAIPDNGCPNCK